MPNLSWLNPPQLEISGRTGLLLGAFVNGLSFQPNLVPRRSGAQAVISGIAAATAFGWSSSSHSLLRSVANRIPGSQSGHTGRAIAGLAVDGVVAAGAIAASRALPVQPRESAVRASARLAATAMAASATAGLGADMLEGQRGRPGNRAATLAATVAAWGLGFTIARHGTGGAGYLARHLAAAEEHDAAGAESLAAALAAADLSVPLDEGPSIEEEPAQVVVPAAAAAGLAVTAALFGMTWAESRLSGLAAGAAARAIGGESDDHRTLGRVVVWAGIAGLGWWGFTRVNAALTVAGLGPDPAHTDPPVLAEVTGGPGSLIPWTKQSRESRRWLSAALTADAISEVMGEPATQPIRVYASLESAEGPAERAALLLAEIDRTQALRRPVFALFSPTGSGYVNYVASETLEYLTRGACASAAIQYSVLPSALSLTKVGVGVEQTRAVVNGIVARLLRMDPDERPTFVLFGESLGAQVSQDMFAGQGIGAVEGVGLSAAVWVGTPAASRWMAELWDDRPLGVPPAIGPDGAYLPRSVGDWVALEPEDRARVRYLLLQNGNDPVPKFAATLLWRRPAWLGPDTERPPGAPRGTHWLPITTFFTTFIDLQNSLRPTPGRFVQGGHDYRLLLPDVIRSVFRLSATEEQMAQVQDALRRRELTWEVRRRWVAAVTRPESERPTALAALVDKVSHWTGSAPDLESVRRLAHRRL